jgi:hypothetical protein
MRDSPIAIAGVLGDFISPDDEALFSFVSALRLSVREKVAAEQLRGSSLSEIVDQVREMTRLAEQQAECPKPFSPYAFRAISRQSLAWCIEAYHPPAFIEERDVSADHEKFSVPAVLARAARPVNSLSRSVTTLVEVLP